MIWNLKESFEIFIPFNEYSNGYLILHIFRIFLQVYIVCRFWFDVVLQNNFFSNFRQNRSSLEDKNLKLRINPFENDSYWNVYYHFYIEYLANLNKSIWISSYKCRRRFFNSASSINMETNYLGIIGTSIIFNLNSVFNYCNV